MEDSVVTNTPNTDDNDEYIDNKIIIDYAESITSGIDPLQNKIMEI